MMHWISLYKKFADCIPKEQLVDCLFILCISGHAPLLQGDASHWAGSPLPWRHFFPNSLSFLNLKRTRLILWISHCWFDTRWLYSMSHSELPEKVMASHSSTLAWKIPWKEEPGRLRSMGLLSRTQLSEFPFTFHFHALEKEMAVHSRVLAWRIPGMGEPGGLPSMGRTE